MNGKLALLICALQLSVLAAKHCTGPCRHGDPNAQMPFVMQLKEEHYRKCKAANECPMPGLSRLADIPCGADGKAGEYECHNVDLKAFIPLKDLGSSGDGNDIWGWTDPETSREYAIVGCADGSSFVDVTEPTDPKVIGFLRTHTVASSWRDMKVHANHAFIISEASNHGMQIFDLTRLRGMEPSPPGGPIRQLEADAHYDEMTSTHNIVGNEDTGFMYAVGTRTCTGGLHMINVQDPKNPEFAGCFGGDGYVHDAECVVYKGPDTKYHGKEICFCYNENTLTIVDVEDKDNPNMLSRVPYDRAYYTHQGWLNEEQTHLLLNDELDELYGPEPRTRSLIWNVEELEHPTLKGSFFSEKLSTDHNLYIRGKLAYEANYCAGLRILDITNIQAENDPQLEEVGYFDVAPDCNSPGFSGSWSSYPYFPSHTIVVQSIERGLFVLKYTGHMPE